MRSRGDSDWKGYFQIGPCAPQLSLALRHRVCLSLIERAERERQSTYHWIVRARPDIAIPCTLADSLVFRHGMVLYVMDFVAFMPRRAAETVLREVPLAREWNLTGCFDYLDENAMGHCNGEVAHHAGWRTAFLNARVWAPHLRRFAELDVVYPARPLPEEASCASECARPSEEIRLDTRFVPFGNRSSDGNPNAPNGELHPECLLAENATSATQRQHASRQAVPYLVVPGEPLNAGIPPSGVAE